MILRPRVGRWRTFKKSPIRRLGGATRARRVMAPAYRRARRRPVQLSRLARRQIIDRAPERTARSGLRGGSRYARMQRICRPPARTRRQPRNRSSRRCGFSCRRRKGRRRHHRSADPPWRLQRPLQAPRGERGCGRLSQRSPNPEQGPWESSRDERRANSRARGRSPLNNDDFMRVGNVYERLSAFAIDLKTLGVRAELYGSNDGASGGVKDRQSARTIANHDLSGLWIDPHVVRVVSERDRTNGRERAGVEKANGPITRRHNHQLVAVRQIRKPLRLLQSPNSARLAGRQIDLSIDPSPSSATKRRWCGTSTAR